MVHKYDFLQKLHLVLPGQVTSVWPPVINDEETPRHEPTLNLFAKHGKSIMSQLDAFGEVEVQFLMLKLAQRKVLEWIPSYPKTGGLNAFGNYTTL